MLNVAAVCGQTDVCKYLLGNNALVNHKTKYGKTALYWAVKYHKFDVCKLLLQYRADVINASYDNNSLIDTANTTKDENIIHLIKEHSKIRQMTILGIKRIIDIKRDNVTELENEYAKFNQLKQSLHEKRNEIDYLQKELDCWKNDASEKKVRLSYSKSEIGKAMLQKQITECEGMTNTINEQLSKAKESVNKYEEAIKEIEPVTERYEKEKQEFEYFNKCFDEGKYDNITKQLKKDCPICLEGMKPHLKIFQCAEGHLLCERCYEKVRETTEVCPCCRKNLVSYPMRNKALEELNENLEKAKLLNLSSD